MSIIISIHSLSLDYSWLTWRSVYRKRRAEKRELLMKHKGAWESAPADSHAPLRFM